MAWNSTVIALVDIDSFECQVWQTYFKGFDSKLPFVVADHTGRLLSVNYEAKALGIQRDTRLPQAVGLCQRAGINLQIFHKPHNHGKSDTNTVRNATWEILDTIKDFCDNNAYGVKIECASSDEFYLDISEEVTRRQQMSKPQDIRFDPRTYLEGRVQKCSLNGLHYRMNQIYPKDHEKYCIEERLVYGALFIQDLCNNLFYASVYQASAGVATNKLMAKLGCGFNKPKGITIFPNTALPRVSQSININQLPGLGGKQGDDVKICFGIEWMSELARISYDQLEDCYRNDPDQVWKLFSKSHGICEEKVITKTVKDEVSCSRTFQENSNSNAINNLQDLHKYLYLLAEEMTERLDEERIRHCRQTQNLKVQFNFIYKNTGKHANGSFPINPHFNPDMISTTAYHGVLDNLKINIQSVVITKLTIVAKNFSPIQPQPQHKSFIQNSFYCTCCGDEI